MSIVAGCAGWVPISICARYLRLPLNPRLVGQRVEVRVDEREVVAVALDTGEIAAAHRRSIARHRTITALEHARALKDQRAERRGRAGRETAVEVRSLDVYDQLIA